jgi:hypothetical protein
MSDLIRLLPQVAAALAIAAFFLLAALVLFGTVVACVRWRKGRRPSAPPRRLPEDRIKPVYP